MFLDVYVGRRGGAPGDVPAARSPLFPCGTAAFRELERHIEQKLLPGGATQHIAYVAPASKEQIAAFYQHLFGSDPLRPTRPDPDPPTESSVLRAWIRNMEDDGHWCLVGIE